MKSQVVTNVKKQYWKKLVDAGKSVNKDKYFEAEGNE
jgi:hypothetical protein